MDNQIGYWKECLYKSISANKWKNNNNRIRISPFVNPHKLVDLGINHQQLLVSQKERQPDYMYFLIEDQNTFTKEFSSLSHLQVLNVVKLLDSTTSWQDIWKKKKKLNITRMPSSKFKPSEATKEMTVSSTNKLQKERESKRLKRYSSQS